jgi:hypothetical protein
VILLLAPLDAILFAAALYLDAQIPMLKCPHGSHTTRGSLGRISRSNPAYVYQGNPSDLLEAFMAVAGLGLFRGVLRE